MLDREPENSLLPYKNTGMFLLNLSKRYVTYKDKYSFRHVLNRAWQPSNVFIDMILKVT